MCGDLYIFRSPTKPAIICGSLVSPAKLGVPCRTQAKTIARRDLGLFLLKCWKLPNSMTAGNL